MSEFSQGQSAPESTAPVSEVQEPQTETQPEVVEKKEENFFAPKFAALSRKEKSLRSMEQQIKQREAEVAQRLAEIESKSKSTQETEIQLLAELKKNPLKFMEKHGLTYEQLTELQLNAQNPTPEMLMEQMEAKLRAEMEEKYGKLTETLKEKEEREAQEKYEATVSSYKQELSSFIQSNADTYELIASNNATDLMFETAQAFYDETGKVPDNETLAKAVEEHLEEQARQILKLKKFQPAQKTEAKPEAKTSQTAPTLSNTLAAEVPKSSMTLLSDEQSIREAAKHLKWNE